MQTSQNQIPQFIPYWGDEEKKAVGKILDGDYLNEHKTTREFEVMFSKYVGAKYCITCTSGTIALYLALLSSKYKLKGTMQIPDFNGIFVHNATVQAGLEPILMDVSEKGILKKMDAGFTVQTNGRIDMPMVLEDCCQAINHHTKGMISCYSFASTKHATTAGQGGAVCCDDENVFESLCKLKDHGRNERQNLKPMSDLFNTWGTNFKFTEIQAAFGIEQLKRLPWRLERLEKMYEIVHEDLKTTHSVDFIADTPKWYIDILVEKPEIVIERMKKFGIQCRRFPKPLHLQNVCRFTKTGSDKFLNSFLLYEKGIFLPSTTNLSDEQIHYITDALKKSI